MAMDGISLDFKLMPKAMHLTQVACLERICEAADRGLDETDVAGLTGLAFRTSLCLNATPVSIYHTWAWEPSFRRWLDGLGIDGDIGSHSFELKGYSSWLSRKHARVAEALERGFPVMYWDNAGFGLVLGVDSDGYLVSGIPRAVIHPFWLDQIDAQGFISRAIDPAHDASLLPKRASRNVLTPSIDPYAFLLMPFGVTRFDPEEAMQWSLVTAHRELAGMIEFPWVHDDLEHAYDLRFGIKALERLISEIADGTVHQFGMALAFSTGLEGRTLAVQYLKRLSDDLAPGYKGRLDQLAGMFKTSLGFWRGLTGVIGLPFTGELELKRTVVAELKENLYQVVKTEQTAMRILSGLAHEVLESRR